MLWDPSFLDKGCFVSRTWSGYQFPPSPGADDQPGLQSCPTWLLRAAVHGLVCEDHVSSPAEGRTRNPSTVEERTLRWSKGLRSSEAPSSHRDAASWLRWGAMSHLSPHRREGSQWGWAVRRMLGTCSPSSCPGTWPWLKEQGQDHPCLRSLQSSLQEVNLQPVTCLN